MRVPGILEAGLGTEEGIRQALLSRYKMCFNKYRQVGQRSVEGSEHT
jgi:hypothetical protein